MNEKLITVTGKGAIQVEPDVTRVELTLLSTHDTYEDAYEKARNNTERLSQIMNEVSLDTTLPKTIGFNIDKKTRNEYDRQGNYKYEKLIGFVLKHIIRIDIGMDNLLLNSIIKLIGKKLKHAEISIGHTVRDPRPFQLKMLERAVKDAKEKATIMAKACDCELGPVKEINYSVRELHIYSQARMIQDPGEAICCDENSLEITPADLEASDDVTVVWYLSDDTDR